MIEYWHAYALTALVAGLYELSHLLTSKEARWWGCLYRTLCWPIPNVIAILMLAVYVGLWVAPERLRRRKL